MTDVKEEKEGQPEGKSPEEWAKYWQKQFSLAKKKTKKWHKDGDYANDRYLGKAYTDDDNGLCEAQLNLFHSNITTLQSMLFGQIPKVEVDRTFADANDDIARVAGEMATRMLNQDIMDAGEDYATCLRSSLQDRLIPGMGSARVVYSFEEEEVEVPEVKDPMTGEVLSPATTQTKVVNELVDEVYIHWKDRLWSPCRTYSEMRWLAYRSYMDHDELVERFGEDLAREIPLTSKGAVRQRDDRTQDEKTDIHPEAEVWEIWNKSTKSTFWYVEGMEKTLEEQDDPLELDGFWPEPPPMLSNATTNEYLPRPDYAIAQDLYREIDELETRITLLTRACKAVGVYDMSATQVARMLTEGCENQLIPAENWAAFAEKGGMDGVVDWLPIEAIANTIQILTEKQAQKIQQLYEVTGISDVIRGASQKYEAAATTKTKAQFASIRVQALQEEFARFASDLQALKFEIIQKHFQPYCIIQQSNAMYTFDAQDQQLIQQAVELIKDREKAKWRVKIRPETLAMADYAQLKVDRSEYLTAVATFMQSAAPLAEMDAQMAPVLFQLLQWGLAGFKGSSQIEGVIDRAIAVYQKKADDPNQQKKDPEQTKADAKMQELQMKMQIDMQKHQAEMQMKQEEHRASMMQDQQKFKLEMAQMQQEFHLKMTELMMELKVKKQEQQDQFRYNSLEREHELSVNEQQATLDQQTAREQAKISNDSAREQAKIKSQNKDRPNA